VAEGPDLRVPRPQRSGQDTTIRLLNGHDRADRGAARVLGLDPHEDSVPLNEFCQRAARRARRFMSTTTAAATQMIAVSESAAGSVDPGGRDRVSVQVFSDA
jgi:hypothetical protein